MTKTKEEEEEEEIEPVYLKIVHIVKLGDRDTCGRFIKTGPRFKVCSKEESNHVMPWSNKERK